MPLLVNLATNIGPEFLGHIADRIQHDAGAPDAQSVAQCTLVLWMIGARNTGRHGVAHNLGVIELKLATIASSDEDAAHRIRGAVPGSARAELEIARVLTQDRREHRGGHQGANSGVGKERAKALPVPLETLPIRRISVPSLSDQCDHRNERNRDRVGHCLVRTGEWICM